MAYKLAEEDKLCGVIYPTYEGFSPIPKATCEMLESKCEQTIVVKCGESSKEDKNPESQSGSASASASESTSVSESVSESSNVNNSNAPEPEKPVLTDEEIEGIISIVYNHSNLLGHIEVDLSNIVQSVTEATPVEIDKFKSSRVKELLNVDVLNGYEVEVTVNKNKERYPRVNEDDVSKTLYTFVYKVTKPNGDVYTSNTFDIPPYSTTKEDFDKLLPTVEPFSKVVTKDGQVVEVPEVSNEDKRAFEDKIINDLKAKLPEGTTVEAVLEGPKYEKGSEVLSGKTNYDLNVRITKLGDVYEHTYKVPHTEEAPQEVPEAPEEDNPIRNDLVNFIQNNYLGSLTYNPISGYSYQKYDGMSSLEFEIKKLKAKYSDYSIEYTLKDPEKTPASTEDAGNEYLHFINFKVSKGSRAFNVSGYLSRFYSEVDHL